MKVKRTSAIPLNVMLTKDERSRFDVLARERGMSLRELVVSSVLGTPTGELFKYLELKTGMDDLRARLVALEDRIGPRP